MSISSTAIPLTTSSTAVESDPNVSSAGHKKMLRRCSWKTENQILSEFFRRGEETQAKIFAEYENSRLKKAEAKPTCEILSSIGKSMFIK